LLSSVQVSVNWSLQQFSFQTEVLNTNDLKPQRHKEHKGLNLCALCVFVVFYRFRARRLFSYQRIWLWKCRASL
jgi:hypothetical protein